MSPVRYHPQGAASRITARWAHWAQQVSLLPPLEQYEVMEFIAVPYATGGLAVSLCVRRACMDRIGQGKCFSSSA